MKLLVLAQGLSLSWRRINATLLRLFLRLVPSETHRVFALTLIAGGHVDSPQSCFTYQSSGRRLDSLTGR